MRPRGTRHRAGRPQDTVLVTYLSGGVPTPNWNNLTERPYGRLVLGNSAMAPESDHGTRQFVLPLADVRDATAKAEQLNAGPITRPQAATSWSPSTLSVASGPTYSCSACVGRTPPTH